MTVQEYIDKRYDGSATWFMEEINQGNHCARIANVVANMDYLAGRHKVLGREDSHYKGKVLKTRKTILNYAKTVLRFHDTFLLGKKVGLSSSDAKTVETFNDIYKLNYELIVALTDGTEHNLGNVRGEKGDKGATGAKGADGRNGIDGAKGTDGVSPTVAVTETTNGHTVAITDVNGTQSFEVLNGKDGASGSSSGGASSTSGGDIYSNDEIAIGTWIDGKTIYRSIVDIQLPAISKSGTPQIYSFKHGLSIDTIVDERMFTPTFNIKSFFSNLGFSPVNLAKISSIATLKDYLIRVAVAPSEIMVDYGYWWNDTKLKCIIDYTKK